jgi:predicted acyl esterase
MRLVPCAVVCTFLLAVAAPANGTITSVFSNTLTPVPCAVQSGGVRLCDETTFSPPRARSTVRSFDNVPIDVRVAFPPEPSSGPDGPYPVMLLFPGYGASKFPLDRMQVWLTRGYATLSMSPRGFGESCGTAASRQARPACSSGYVRFADDRYEVRDAQEFAGLLADEGRTSFTQIGAFGGSYGAGISLALAVLRDRKMLPDGSLVPWTSPAGTAMRIAAAAPETPWTDFAYSLAPNGRTLDYVADAPYLGRTGVLKQSFENWLYNLGLGGYYPPAGADPDADLTGWHNGLNAGEPYDDSAGNPLPFAADWRDELTTHHSAYYIDHSEAPAPVLISDGFTDDLFPADEAIRYFNRTRTQFPGADMSLFFASIGHWRSQNKDSDLALRRSAEFAWLDYYVKGAGSVPFHGVQALTQVCPSSLPSDGPYSAASWAGIAPGEVRYDFQPPQTIVPGAGSVQVASAFDPLAGASACATAPATDQAGTATFRSALVPGDGYTLMGSPTVIANVTSPGSDSEVAARLLDVDPATNNETLVARGLWRPAISSTAARQVFQLHPNGYKFPGGHFVKLELLSQDATTTPDSSYGRPSNNQQSVTVKKVQLRLPVSDAVGSLGNLVQPPLPKFLPPGYQLARDFAGP